MVVCGACVRICDWTLVTKIFDSSWALFVVVWHPTVVCNGSSQGFRNIDFDVRIKTLAKPTEKKIIPIDLCTQNILKSFECVRQQFYLAAGFASVADDDASGSSISMWLWCCRKWFAFYRQGERLKWKRFISIEPSNMILDEHQPVMDSINMLRY